MPQRVLHVHTLPVISGSGINTFLTMKGLARRGYEVELACRPGGRLEDAVRAEGMAFRPVPSFEGEIAPVRDALAAWQLRRMGQLPAAVRRQPGGHREARSGSSGTHDFDQP